MITVSVYWDLLSMQYLIQSLHQPSETGPTIINSLYVRKFRNREVK